MDNKYNIAILVCCATPVPWTTHSQGTILGGSKDQGALCFCSSGWVKLWILKWRYSCSTRHGDRRQQAREKLNGPGAMKYRRHHKPFASWLEWGAQRIRWCRRMGWPFSRNTGNFLTRQGQGRKKALIPTLPSLSDAILFGEAGRTVKAILQMPTQSRACLSELKYSLYSSSERHSWG